MKTFTRVVTVITLALPFMVSPGSGSAAPTAVRAAADAYVQSHPDANKGTATSLRISNGTKVTKVTYVRFDVPPASGTVGRATLRVYASSDSKCSLGVQVLRAANDSWRETSITWANQPGSTGSVIATKSWTARGYVEFDVTAAARAGAPVSFLLRHAPGCTGHSDVSLNSREATSNAPELVVESNADPSPPVCSDGVDNDGDGRTDYPSDPGCTSSTDGDETDASTPPTGTKVVLAAGDIVCDPTSSTFAGANPSVCQHRATSSLLAGADAILPLGDLQYPDGTLQQFLQGYDPSWGQQAARTYPAIGNHEYHVSGAPGYFDYWASRSRPTGGRTGYYSFDLGSWHLISLNSNCAAVPCGEGSPQNDWLERDLAATTQPCIAAYWHHPLFNSGTVHGSAAPTGAKAFWDDLYAARADVVLNGHEHNYQRYAKQTPSGLPSSVGIREFIAGTGGKSHYGLLASRDANYETGNATHYGVLKLYLSASSYRWEFVSISGSILDAGGPVACN